MFSVKLYAELFMHHMLGLTYAKCNKCVQLAVAVELVLFELCFAQAYGWSFFIVSDAAYMWFCFKKEG